MEKKQPIKPKSLNFNENYNNKFLCFSFIVIDDGSLIEELEVSETIQIKLRKSHFCFAKLIKRELLSLEEIIIRGYNFLDRDLNEKDYVNLWKKKELNVFYFQKITQLNLFENHDNLIHEN